MKNSLLGCGDDKMDSVGFSVGGDPDSPTLDSRQNSINLFNPRRTHSRSSSWSFNGSTRPGASDLGSSIASMNPIRSVIREFVPTLGTTEEDNSHPLIRAGSNMSLRSINSNTVATPTNYIVQSRGDTPPITVNSSNSLSSNDTNNRDQPHADHAPFVAGNGNLENDEGQVELTDGLRWIEQNTFFFALILIRYAWINKSDLFVLIAMFTTYFHCNDVIRSQVAMKNRREKLVLLLVIVFLCSNISFVYYVFKDEQLYNCLAFMPPKKFLDLWTLTWCICITDFIVRFITMIIKSLISLCFLRIIPTRKKSKYYVLVEYLSQFYRTLLPTPLWFGYFSNYTDTGPVFAVLVTALYLMIKGAVIISRGKDSFRAIRNFINDKSYGVAMKREDLLEYGESQCSICQDDFSNPIRLKCHGSSQRVLVNVDVSTPAGMAVDWTNDKLYWTDSDLGRIYVSEINGSSVSAIVTVNEGTLTSIAVHPAKGLLFYGVNVNDKKSFIRSAHLDGTNNRKVGSYDNSIPMLMTIDYQSDRLYWIDNINIKVLSIFINGSDFEELLESGTLYESKGLTHYGNYLYWTDEIDGSIYQIEKEPPYEAKKLISNREDLRDISVFHRNREMPDSHPCWSDNGGCSHLCFGVPSDNNDDEYTVTFTASCGCPTGYVLGDDAKTCASEIDRFLLFGTVSRIGMMSLEVDRDIDITTPIYPKPTKVLSVDYDLKNDYVYWIEEDFPIIYRAPIDGGDKEIVIRYGLVRPTALAVDWLGGNLYFGDSGSRRLEVCRLDGSSRKVLISDNNVGEVLSITVDLYSEYIFWSSSEPSPQVFRSAMDGSNTMAIIHSSEVSLPVSLAIDNRGASSKLFVADSDRQRITVFDTNGKGQDLFKITDSPITGLAVDEDNVYWIDGDTGILHRSRKDGNGQSNRVNTNLMGVSDLRLIRKTHLLQNRALSHNYACKEGLCSHLCLPNWDINRYSCACPTGIEDQVNCPTAPSLYLLFTTSNSIRRLSLESNEYHDVSLISDLHKVSYIDYHLTSSDEGRIYWTDPLNQSIMMANIDGSNTRSFLQFKNNLRGVSVDWTTGSVYYVNAGVPSIEMADRTGTFVKVILNDSVVQDPVDLAVFPLEGFVFWTEWNGSPSRLMRSKMDGSNPLTVVNLDNQKPTHLTLSADSGYLYWVDANSGSIQRIKYDGTRYEVVWRDIGQPFGVAVYQQSVFWSDVIEGMIYRCDSQRQLTQKRMQYVERHSGTPKGMVIVTLNRKGEIDGNYSGSACGYKNGGCKYLCAPISQEERKCLCPSSQPDCVEYAGIHSWTIPPFLVSTTSAAAVPTISATSTTATVATNSSSSPTPAVQIDSEIIGAILDNVSITVLVLIGIFLVAIVFVLCFILLLFSKYKSLTTRPEPAPSSKYELKSLDNKPTTRLMATNPLYEKTTITANEGEGKASASLKFSGPRYQLNNTVELQTRNKAVLDEFNAGNIRLRSLNHAEPELKPKLKVMNTTTLNVPLTEEPEEYKITPVQSRRNHSSSKSCSSPPPPTEVPITVHYPDSSPTHKPNVSLPHQPPPRPAIVVASSPTKGTRHVQFATSVVEAPPVPPRSGRLSSCGSSFNQTIVSLDYDPSPPPPLSAPATSPPPTFSFHDISITVPTEYKVSARNPIFGRCSSSSESDISGIRDQQEDETGGRDGGLSKEMSSAGFASDSNIVFQ